MLLFVDRPASRPQKGFLLIERVAADASSVHENPAITNQNLQIKHVHIPRRQDNPIRMQF